MAKKLKQEIVTLDINDLNILEVNNHESSFIKALEKLNNGFIFFSNPKECIIEVHTHKAILKKKKFKPMDKERNF